MTHDITNEYARCFIGEPTTVKKSPLTSLAGVAVREAQRAGFGANAGGKSWVSLRQHRKLHLSGHPKFFAHLLVLGVDLSLRLLQTSNVLARKRCWSCTSVRVKIRPRKESCSSTSNTSS